MLCAKTKRFVAVISRVLRTDQRAHRRQVPIDQSFSAHTPSKQFSPQIRVTLRLPMLTYLLIMTCATKLYNAIVSWMYNS